LPAAGTPERMDYTYWMHYAEGTFMPLMIVSLIMSRIESAQMPFFVKPIAKGIVGKVRGGYLSPNIKRNLEYMNTMLGNSTWFCGDEMTAADIQMSFPLDAAEVRTDLKKQYANLNSFLQRVRARPAYQAALEKGGPYRLMGAD
jgi:glutathione S-transferase